MKILVFLAVWKRPEITEICFMGLNRLRKNSRYPIEAFAVISEESMVWLCEKYNIKYTFYKNEPLGEKKNYGLTEAMKLEWDYLIEIGSDDLLKDELLELYAPFMEKGVEMFGTKDSIIIDSFTGQARRLRSDTPYGLARCIKREVIEKHCHGMDIFAKEQIMCPGRSVRANEKGFFKVSQAEEGVKLGRMEILGQPRYRLWKDEITKGLDNNSDFFLMTQGIEHRGIETTRPLAIDIKSDENIWKFNPDLGEKFDIERALEGLSQEEQSKLVALWKQRKELIEYAGN